MKEFPKESGAGMVSDTYRLAEQTGPESLGAYRKTANAGDAGANSKEGELDKQILLGD